MGPEAREIPFQAIANGSVVSWQHINLLGEYDFSDENCVRLERLRRLWNRCIPIKSCSRDAESVGNILHLQLAGVH
jgi:hypothetical protein